MIEADAAAIDQYRADGATVVRRAVGAEWLERLAGAIERDIADPGPFDHSYDVEGGRFHGNLRIWQHDPVFEAFCLDSPAPEIAAAGSSPSRSGPNNSASAYERNPDYEPMLDIEAARDRYDIITWDLEPGDVYVSAGMTVHGAAGNPTVDRRRRAGGRGSSRRRPVPADRAALSDPGSNRHLTLDTLAP